MENETTPSINQSLPPIQQKKSKKPFLGVILAIILIISVSYGVYTWQNDKVNSLSREVVVLKTPTSKTSSKVSQAATPAANVPVVTTDTLPNGTTVSYPLIVANANVVWWSDGNNTPAADNIPADGQMIVSDKHVIEFLSTLPTDVIQNLCQDQWNTEIGFQMGIYNTSTGTLDLHNQYENCVVSVANNKGSKYATQAQQAITDATADLNAWAKSLTVTKQ